MDLTPAARIVRAEQVVREQRSETMRPFVWEDLDGGEVVEVDDYRELESELARLQATVTGEDVRVTAPATEIKGRRRADTPESELPDFIEVGDYWKVLDDEWLPKIVHAEGKLTEECWRLVVPLPRDTGFENPNFGFGIANLDHHTVREEDDGTISVRPNDGSSNSILVRKGETGPRWHGYVERGVLRGD